jgi:hypothetical protein
LGRLKIYDPRSNQDEPVGDFVAAIRCNHLASK